MASTRREDRNWEGLKEATRKRYLAAGVTRAKYLGGANLKKARGHANRERPVPTPPPTRAWQAAQEGDATLRQLDQLKRWQQTEASSWLRAGVFSEDTAANLSTIDLTPRNWASATIYPRRDGTYEVYIESRLGGPTRSAKLANLDEVREFQDAVEFKNQGLLDDAGWRFDEENWDVEEVDFYDTDQVT